MLGRGREAKAVPTGLYWGMLWMWEASVLGLFWEMLWMWETTSMGLFWDM